MSFGQMRALALQLLGCCCCPVAALLHPDREHFRCPERFFPDSVTHPILKRNFKTIFFFLFSPSDLPQYTGVFFSFLLIIAALAVCQFVGFKTGSCLLALLSRQRGIYLIIFLFFSQQPLTHPLKSPSIHPSHPPPPTYPLIPPLHTQLSIHPTFGKSMEWAMGHQESHLHLISVLTWKPDNLTTMLRRPYIYNGEVWGTMGDTAGVAGNDS